MRAHLHAGPAVFIVACGDHGDGRRIEFELRKIGDGRKCEPDIEHFATGLHQPDGEGLLDGKRIAAEIVTGGDGGAHAHFMQIGAQPQTESLHAQKVQFLAEQPAGVIFPEAVGGDLGFVFVSRGVGLEVGTGFHLSLLYRSVLSSRWADEMASAHSNLGNLMGGGGRYLVWNGSLSLCMTSIWDYYPTI